MGIIVQVVKSYLIRLSLAALALLVYPSLASGSIYNWVGTTTEWNLGSNWKVGSVVQSVPPGINDDVQIGVTAFTKQPLLSTGPTSVSINSLTFGPLMNASITLTVNSSYNLNITGDLKVSTSTSHFGTFAATLAGGGAIACQNVQVGDLTTFPIGGLVFFNQVKLISTITFFHINSNASVYSTTWGIVLGILNNYAAFSLQGGTTEIDGNILTASVSGGFLNSNPGIATFSIDVATAASPVLQLKNTAPINTASMANSIDFYNNTGGAGTATVIYNYSGLLSQTVYTDNTGCLNNSPSTYQYLNLVGGCTEVPNGSNLLVEKDLNSTATAVTFNSNNPTVSIGNNWTNSSNVTQATGNITVGGSLTNNSGGTLNLGSANLSIAGDYINNSGGTYTQSSGTTTFNGAAQLLIDGSSGGTIFNNVTFSNGGTKSISAGSFGVSSIGVLSVLGSSTILDAGGLLTMYASSSSPLAYAQIAPVTGQITGNVNYQVYFTGGAGYRNYRSMASPVYNNVSTYSSSNGTYKLSSLQGSFIITGPGGLANGFDNSSNNGSTIRLYNPATNAYTFIASISPAAPTIASGTAFYMYFRGSRTIPTGTGTLADPFGTKTNRGTGSYATADPVMYTYTGVPNQGNLPALSFLAGDKKFYFLANPYAATLDANVIINNALISGTNYFIKTNTWIWSPSAANYAIYNFTTPAMSVNNAKRYIVPGQGFFIQASNTTAVTKTLTIAESMKSVTNNSNAARFLYQAEPQVLAVTDPPILRLKFSKDSILSDEIAVAFIDSSKATMDNYDATHLEGSSLTLSSVTTDNQYLANDVRPFTGDKTIFQLYITPDIDTTYNIKLSYKNALMSNYKISLKDSLFNTTTDITNSGYTFSVIASQSNTYAKRFKLIVEPLPPSPEFMKFTAQLNPVKKVALRWNSIANRGNIRYQVQRSADKKTFANIGSEITVAGNNPTGSYQMMDQNPLVGLSYYRLMQTDIFNDNSISDTIAIANNPGLLNGISKNGFVLYANPVKDVVQIVSDKSYTGKMKLQIYNNMGQMQASDSFTGMTAQEPIQKNVTNLKMGVYTAHIAENGREVVSFKFIKQ